MARIVRAALIQTEGLSPREKMVEHQVGLLRRAAEQGAQVTCLQELSTGPYFCQEEDKRWYDLAEPVPDGPTIQRMQGVARETGMVLIVPVYESDGPGFLYNTAAVIDSDGSYLGKYRKTHIPHSDNFLEKYYFRPGNLGYPIFETSVGKIGAYICYDRHFPEGARALGLAGAEMVFIPSATAGFSRPLWDVEQRFHAIANGYFVGTINRVGTALKPDVQFYGHSYFCDPMGGVLAEAGEEEEIVVADLDLDQVAEVRANLPFYRDRRPDMYGVLTAP